MKWTNSLKDNLPNLTQEERDNRNRPRYVRIKSITSNLKRTRPRWIHSKFYQIEERNYTNTLQSLSEDTSRRNTIQLALRGQHYPNIKTRQRH